MLRSLFTLAAQIYYGHEATKVRKVRSVSVSIGRNIGANPMSEADWQTFTSETLRYINRHSSAVHFVGFGEGIYEVNREESFTVSASVYRDETDRLSYVLRNLCTTYHQEAFALSLAKVSIVTA